MIVRWKHQYPTAARGCSWWTKEAGGMSFPKVSPLPLSGVDTHWSDKDCNRAATKPILYHSLKNKNEN